MHQASLTMYIYQTNRKRQFVFHLRFKDSYRLTNYHNSIIFNFRNQNKVNSTFYRRYNKLASANPKIQENKTVDHPYTQLQLYISNISVPLILVSSILIYLVGHVLFFQDHWRPMFTKTRFKELSWPQLLLDLPSMVPLKRHSKHLYQIMLRLAVVQWYYPSFLNY